MEMDDSLRSLFGAMKYIILKLFYINVLNKDIVFDTTHGQSISNGLNMVLEWNMMRRHVYVGWGNKTSFF